MSRAAAPPAAAGPPLVSLLVAAAENGVIGRVNALPWHLPDDLRRFKAITMGKPMLMGRRTYESIGKPLPGRVSIVLTRQPDWRASGVTVVRSLEAALQAAQGHAELVCIGGAEIFALCLPISGKVHLTRVHAAVAGDTYLPPLDATEWTVAEEVSHPADARHAYAMTFLTLVRKH